MADTNRNREVVLLPWQYVYLRQEKGDIKVLVGPYKFDLGTAEALVVWDRSASRYNDVNLEDAKKAVQQMVIVDKGSYAVLANPAKGSPEHPETGKGNATVDLAVGQTINVQGPGMFALWPGQSVDIVKGHHLSRNQYVRIQIADPVEARANWNKAAVSAEVTVLPPDGDTATAPIKKSSFFDSPPADLAMGKTYNVRGDQVSFYMPPTGVTVVADPETSTPAAPVYVREAVTLQTLQYAIACGAS